MRLDLLICVAAAAFGSFPDAAHAQTGDGVLSCYGEGMGVACATENPCTQGVCLMEDCLEAPKIKGAECSLLGVGGISGVCKADAGSAALVCSAQETAPPAPEEDGPSDGVNSDTPPDSCFVFPENAECTLSRPTGGQESLQCEVRQIECALQIVCDSGSNVLMGTVAGNTVSLVTAGDEVKGEISVATGAMSFSDGRACTPVTATAAPANTPPAGGAPAPTSAPTPAPAQCSDLTKKGLCNTEEGCKWANKLCNDEATPPPTPASTPPGAGTGVGTVKPGTNPPNAPASTAAAVVAAPPADAVAALAEVTWNNPRTPDVRQNDVVITVSFLVEGDAVLPLWQVKTDTGFPEVTTSPTGQAVVAALTEYVRRNTVYAEHAFDLVPIHPRGAVPPTVQVMKYSLVKHECRQVDRDALLALLMDPARVQAALALRSTSLGGVEGVSIIEVDETPVTKNVVAADTDDAASRNNVILILVFTLFFLLIAGSVLYFTNQRKGSEDFDVLPLPATSSTGGIVETTLTDKRAASLLFRSEAVPSADAFVISRLPFNMAKNRFENHLPYDHTRIELNASNGVRGSDYINASLIPGHRDASYIATQAPLASTVRDFWRMVCEQQCTTVAMLTLAQENGVEHSYQYWPHLEGDSNAITFGDITVTTIETKQSIDTAIRKISVSVAPRPRYMDPKFGGKTFVVTHCLFMGFPEKSTPIDTKPFREFRQKVAEASKGKSGATVVHCNNGSGRTGVYICYDMTLARYADCGEADLFESVVTLRKNRPQMVESKAQYLFLHRAFIDEMRGGPLKILGQQPQKHVDFLTPFAVPALLAPFDIGAPGRKICELGELQLVNARGGRFANATLVVLSDLVVLCCEQDEQQVLQGYADRLSVAESLFETVKGADSLCFAIVLDQLYVLAAGDEAIKTDWLRRLKTTDSYVAPGDLAGDRMTSFRPTSRSAALAILNCADPETKHGSTSLKEEFATIPRLFSVGPRTIYKVGRQTAATTGVLRDPLGPKTGNNPIFGAPGGDSSIFFGSPAMLPPNGNYGTRPPAMMDLSIASSYGGVAGQQTALSMDGKVLFPELGRQAAIKTEDLLANKLSELESAILRAAELEHIASGNGGGTILQKDLEERPASVENDSVLEMEDLMEPAYVYDDDDDVQGPAIREADRDFNNAHRAALWQVFRDCDFVTDKVDVEALSALLEEWGLLSADGGEDFVKATLKSVGPMVEVDNFEVTFLAQQRLLDGRIRRYDVADGKVTSPAKQRGRKGSASNPYFTPELREYLRELLGEGKADGVKHRLDVKKLAEALHSSGLLEPIEQTNTDGESGLLGLLGTLKEDAYGRLSVDEFEAKYAAHAQKVRKASRRMSAAHMVRRASRDITQDMTSTPKPESRVQNRVSDRDGEKPGGAPFSQGRPARGDPPPAAAAFTVKRPTSPAKTNSISRQDLMLGGGSSGQLPDHHINEVLKKRGVSIPALALKSLHNERKKAGLDVDNVFTIHGGAKKRMTRNPTMRAKKHYKERPSIQTCTFLANCTCPNCV